MFQKSLFGLCLLALFAFGCSPSAPFVWQDDSVDFVWPELPSTSRIRYLRSLSGSDDFTVKSDGSEMFEWWFGKNQEESSFYTPFAIAVSEKGQVWVADSGSGAVFVVDTEEHEVRAHYEVLVGFPFVSPGGVAVDDKRGRVYVADAAYGKVFVLDFDGDLVSRWAPAEGFKRPSGMALGPEGQLLVADAGAGNVYLFGADGSLVRSVKSEVAVDGRFLRPLAVAFGPNEEVLILDAFSFRVEVQDKNGKLLGTIGRLGDAPGYFARPRGIAVDTNGHVFVSDAAFDNIQVFDMTGNLLTYWGGAGRDAGKFNLPAGVFVDGQGRFFVADSYNHRVQVYQLLE